MRRRERPVTSLREGILDERSSPTSPPGGGGRKRIRRALPSNDCYCIGSDPTHASAVVNFDVPKAPSLSNSEELSGPARALSQVWSRLPLLVTEVVGTRLYPFLG